jgi:hypothetical protein
VKVLPFFIVMWYKDIDIVFLALRIRRKMGGYDEGILEESHSDFAGAAYGAWRLWKRK